MKRRAEDPPDPNHNSFTSGLLTKIRAVAMALENPSAEPQPCSSSSLRPNLVSSSFGEREAEGGSKEPQEPDFKFTGTPHPLLLPNVSGSWVFWNIHWK
jgi:hypothetical protein